MALARKTVRTVLIIHYHTKLTNGYLNFDRDSSNSTRDRKAQHTQREKQLYKHEHTHTQAHLVSAMLVAITILRTPGGGFLNT